MGVLITGEIVNDEALALLRPELEIAINEADLDPRVDGSVLQALGFVEREVGYVKGIVTTIGGILALPELKENGETVKQSYKLGDEKAFRIKQYGGNYSISKLAMKVIRAGDLSKLDSSMAEEVRMLADNVKRLGQAAKLSKSNEAMKLLVNGFSITASDGAGSPAPDGFALFSASHASGDNLVTGVVNGTNFQTQLLAGINKLRAIKNDKGVRYPRPKAYTLIIGPDREALVRKALNDGSKFTGIVEDVRINDSVTVNVFSSVDGFKVELLVVDDIGSPDANGVAIGTGNEMFLIDRNRISMARALQLIKLYDTEVRTYTDQKTQEFTVDCDLGFAVEHFKAEIGIVGYTGA